MDTGMTYDEKIIPNSSKSSNEVETWKGEKEVYHKEKGRYILSAHMSWRAKKVVIWNALKSGVWCVFLDLKYIINQTWGQAHDVGWLGSWHNRKLVTNSAIRKKYFKKLTQFLHNRIMITLKAEDRTQTCPMLQNKSALHVLIPINYVLPEEFL